MTLRHLKIYTIVYQEENITKAAELLHMTQPAVTRAIQELEQHYGTRLFDRINRRLSVTEAGKSFYAYALHIVDSFDQLEKGMTNWDEVGTIRVGTSITIGNFILPKVLLHFKETHPNINIKAVVSNAANLEQALLHNELDFAVIEGNCNQNELHSELLAYDKLIPVLPPTSEFSNCTIDLETLTKAPLLLRETGSAGRSFLNHIFAIHGIMAEPILESVSTQAILQAVHLGLGISFLPEQLVKTPLQTGFVNTCKVTNETFKRENHLVWHKQKFLTDSTKELISTFKTLYS